MGLHAEKGSARLSTSFTYHTKGWTISQETKKMYSKHIHSVKTRPNPKQCDYYNLEITHMTSAFSLNTHCHRQLPSGLQVKG